MKKLNLGNLLLLTAFLMLAFTNAFSQGPGCPNVYAGEDANVNCAGGGCVDLSASFLETGETTTYDVTPIPYAPFPYIGGTTVSVDTDDVWSPAIDLPFNFCFFGGTYDEIVIGSNGVISFDLNSNPPGGFCEWGFDASIPSPQLFRNTIFGVYMDINPAPSPPTSDINYQVLGEAPCRTMVVSVPNVFYFGCNTQRLTSQMVIYETTNVIEVYVLDRPSGCSWNDGNAVIGIQNQAGNLGYTPPGRNTGDWAANTEAWRFTPNGPSNVTFEWLDASGSVIGNTPDITVCPTEEQVYTARASYLNCDGAITVVEDDVLITTSNPFTLDLGDDQQTCDASAVLLTAATDGTPNLSYEWFYNTVSQGPSTVGDDTFSVNFPNSGVYTVEVFDPADITCILSDEINITFNNQPIANTPDDLFQCDNGTNTGIFDLTVNDAVVLGTQVPTDFDITYHNNFFDAVSGASPILNPTTYLITGTIEQIFVRIVDTTGTCFDTESFFINFFPISVSLGEDIETCSTDDIILTADTAGVAGLSYQWFYNAVSQGPSTLGDDSFTVTFPNSGTYSVEVFNNLDATCIVTDQVEVTYNNQPIANEPDDLFQCDNGINTGIFDLTVNDAIVLGAQIPADFNISYHNTAADASSGASPILNPTTYLITGTVEQIFVRIVDTTGTCFDTESFSINFFPITVSLGEDQETCTTNDITLTANAAGVVGLSYQWFYNAVSQGPSTIDDITFTVTAPNSGTYSVEVFNPLDATCIVTDQVEVTYLDPPVANQPNDLFQCDDGINTGIFDLTVNDAVVLGAQDPDVFDISYHNTAPDAASGVAPILNSAAYPITGAVEEIFVRIETADQTDAFLEDFGTGLGRVTHPYTNQTFNGAGGMNPNDYVVTNTSTGLNGGWHQDMEDYTVGDTNGRMIFFDVSEDVNQIELYRRDFTVPANTNHIFDFSMTTMYDTDTNLCPGTGIPSRLIYQVQDASGAVLATTTTGIVENGPNPDWNTYALNFNTGVNTTIQIVLLNDFFGACGNDLVIDDINVISLNTCSDTSSFFINFFPVSVTLGDDQETCTTDDIILTADTAGAPGLSYQWFYNTVPQGPSTVGDDTFTVSSPNSGTYSVEVFDPIDLTCVASDEIEILYNLQPIANEPDDLFQCDDGNNTGIFDLTVNDTVVLGAQDPTEFVLSYHNSAADAASGAAPIAAPEAYLITGVLEQIFVRIENATGTCFATESFLLNFAPVFAGPMTDIGFCDLDGDGFLSINLPELKDAEALGVQDPIFFEVTYHNTLNDANTDINPLPPNYTVFAPGETIFVRVESLDTSTCFAVSSFDISIVVAPGATIPTKYNICDELPNDGFGTFDLTTKDLEITGGNPDAVVSYYITFAQALAGTPAIAPADAFINTVQGFQVVYARVDNINATDCSNIVALELQVNDAPAITDPITDYFVCDLDGNGIETFDLTSKDEEILNSLVDVTLTYHESFADAEAGLFPITPATGYVSPSATIWVRAVNYEDGDISNDALCVTIGQFDLIIGETPSFNVIPEIVACDDEIADGITEFDLNSYNEIITGGNPDVTVTYHATQEFAQDGIPALPVFYTNTTNPEDIWVRVSDVSGCYGIFMSSLVVVPRPEIFEPLPLIYCDDDNDGFGTFILTDADEQVVGGNPAGNLVVSYHVTLSDAINGVLPLVSPYDNEVPFDQIIYVRLFDIASGCYNTTILHLLVEERPAITDPQPLVVCDTDGDGIAVFNLTSAEPDMLQGLTGGPYVVSYFTDMAMTSAIVNPFSFSNSVNPQTIYVTVSDTNNDCESLTTLELRVEIPPLLINPTPLELCDQTDILGPDDELEIFDLTSRIAEITGGDLSVSVSFFESFADMQANTNAIADPTAYQNIIGGVVQNPQTIWIRAQDVNTSCVIDTGVVTLDLIVNPLPSPILPTPLEICDIDNDGFGAFTLTDKDIEIIGNEPGVIVSYHETLSDAENNIFPIGSPYQNIVANLQVVYVRATYDDVPPAVGTGCWRVVELELIVNPTPIVPLDLEPIIACDPDMDGFEVFDLTQRASDIYGTQDVPASTR